MNNLLKFRVWITPWGNAEPSAYMKYIDHLELHVYIGNWERGGYKNAVFQQYTGLNDSKGNPIYEGDILKEYVKNESHTAIGVCKQTLGGWKIFSHPNPSVCYHGWKHEIIGNIFENPELLK